MQMKKKVNLQRYITSAYNNLYVSVLVIILHRFVNIQMHLLLQMISYTQILKYSVIGGT